MTRAVLLRGGTFDFWGKGWEILKISYKHTSTKTLHVQDHGWKKNSCGFIKPQKACYTDKKKSVMHKHVPNRPIFDILKFSPTQQTPAQGSGE